MQAKTVITRITSWFAWVAVVAPVILFPLGYFVVSYGFLAGGLETEAKIDADIISQIISQDPDMWTFEQVRLQELLSRRSSDYPVSRRILNARNVIVSAISVGLDSPVMMRSSLLLDSGVVVGKIEIYRSLRSLLVHTGMIALLGLIVGLVVSVTLRIMPLRAVRRAEEELRKSEAKYRSLVESTEDSIFLVDRDCRYLFLNNNCLASLGFRDVEYTGRAYGELHPREEAEEFCEKATEVFRTGRSVKYEHKNEKKGTYSLLTISPVKGQSGKTAAVNVISKDITHLKVMEAELRALSLTDELTGLYNRRGFFTLAEQELKMANRLRHGIYMLYADMDNLKAINDTHGHKEGDRALREAARILKETYRSSDIVARIGGDEFVVIPIGIGGDNTDAVTRRLQKNLDAHNAKTDRDYRLSLSVGLAFYDPRHPCSLVELLKKGDEAMYAQKRTRHRSSAGDTERRPESMPPPSSA